MPGIEYEDRKIKRRFSPEWQESGEIDIEEELPKLVNVLIAQNNSMVEYIEELHDEIDRLNAELNQVKKAENSEVL